MEEGLSILKFCLSRILLIAKGFIFFPQCKAVFFSQEERQRHTCLNKPTTSERADVFSSPVLPPHIHPRPHMLETDKNITTKTPAFYSATPSITPTRIVHNISEMPTSVLRKSGVPYSCYNKMDSDVDKCHCKTNLQKPGETASRAAKEPLIVCSSCGDVYENSGDALSSFDLTVSARGHRCPNSPSVRGGDPGMDGESTGESIGQSGSAC